MVYTASCIIQERTAKAKVLQNSFSILLILSFVAIWSLKIYPFAKNISMMNLSEPLTGRKFWSWKDYKYHDGSVRGEGYYLDIYEYNSKIAKYFETPDSSFFCEYPLETFSSTKWQPTPIAENEMEILEFATPIYGGWKGKIIDKQSFIRKLAKSPGSYYSYRTENSTEFYIISPKDRIIILIYHNM